MTLDELTDIAFIAWRDASGPYTIDDWRAAVRAILDAVERECVPDDIEEATIMFANGWNSCRDQMIATINALRGEDDRTD